VEPPSSLDHSSPADSARALLGAALRRLGHDVVGHHAADDVLDELAAVLAEQSARLATGEPRARNISGFHESWNSEISDGGRVPSWEDRPFSGVSSPWSMEPDVRREGDGVRATVTFHSAHEGAPGRCHGGLVAGLFDDIMGAALSVIGDGAFTGELTVRYDGPVPLHRELVCTCRVDRREGRKIYVVGEMRDGATLVSSARAVFIRPKEAPTQSTFDPT
jgi:acyl-coenzyme A thioesterase PaaI-like protein